MNIKRVPQEEMKSLNFEELHEWHIKNESVLMPKSDVLEAKQNELKNWIDHDVYEEVEDKGQNCISFRWVMTEKTSDGKQIAKARLVARGYEEENKDSLRTDSPTISKDNLLLLFAIIAPHHWKICDFDIKAAFLLGNPINRDIYLKPPIEAEKVKYGN